MTEKTEALRLADALTEAAGDYWQFHKSIGYGAAAELRRLSAENEELWKEREEPHKTIEMYVRECNRLERERDALKAQRDALLEACRAMLTFIERHAPRGLQPEPGSPVAMARAAIKAVEENT